jgi:EAL and modified HD-GYP domain-containing signal transduction protein
MSPRITLFARQPIHGRDLKVAGYELLFRAPGDECAHVGDPTSATADVIARAMFDVGFDSLVGPHPAWINIAREFLVRRSFESLPPERVVLEVLESVRCDSEVLAALRDARRQGFRIALDDYELHDDTCGLIDSADYIKLDCLHGSPDELRSRFRELGGRGPVLLAEKVESRETFDVCADAGAQYFQGYFFTRPELVCGTEVRTDRLKLIRVVAELNDPGVTVSRLADLVQTDVALAYRLLRYANSAALGRARKFENVRDAITMLGLDRVRACATLMILSSLSNKPQELARTALIRARYCQAIGAARNADAQKHFVAGLFSVLDAYLDDSMEHVVGKLPLDKELSTALISRRGSLGEALAATIACENANWPCATVPNVDDDELAASYLAALTWADATQTAFDTD